MIKKWSEKLLIIDHITKHHDHKCRVHKKVDKRTLSV